MASALVVLLGGSVRAGLLGREARPTWRPAARAAAGGGFARWVARRGPAAPPGRPSRPQQPAASPRCRRVTEPPPYAASRRSRGCRGGDGAAVIGQGLRQRRYRRARPAAAPVGSLRTGSRHWRRATYSSLPSRCVEDDVLPAEAAGRLLAVGAHAGRDRPGAPAQEVEGDVDLAGSSVSRTTELRKGTA